MPIYAAGSEIGLEPAEQATVLNAEQPTTGQASQAVSLVSSRDGGDGLTAISLELSFSGAPGAFSYQLQDADTDVAAAYVNLGAAITAVNAGNYARLETTLTARFVRVLIGTQTANAVTVTAKITR